MSDYTVAEKVDADVVRSSILDFQKMLESVSCNLGPARCKSLPAYSLNLSFKWGKVMQLINGNSYEVLQSIPDNSIDLIYTDPPYDVGEFKPGTGGTVNNVMKLDKTLQPINQITQTNYQLEHFCSECIRVLKEINIYIWCNKKQIPKYFNIFVNEHSCLFDILIWNKSDALPTYSNKYLTDCEYCLYFHKGSGKCFPRSYKDAKTVYLGAINRENKLYDHPNIKPLEFVTSMISNSATCDSVVLDPFMGTGTTGVACKQLGIDNFIGVEINPDYFRTSEIRINGVSTTPHSHKGKNRQLFNI